MAEVKEKQYVGDNAKLMAEWNWERNREISPDLIMAGSGKRIWWKCSKGHEWVESPNNRKAGNACPYCSNHKILVGYNDLSTTYPSLSLEWHPSKNGSMTPNDVTAGSKKKVWWLCSKGHAYEATIQNRSHGRGCPYCSGKKVIQGVNDLASKYPDIAKEWHPTKNGDITPSNISYGSAKDVWWLCSSGHEYRSSPNDRTSSLKGCPYCSGHSVIKTVNDLETLYPSIAAEWCYQKNYPMMPDMVFPHSKKKYWWTCPGCKIDYYASISSRTSGTGCPHCINRYRTSFAEQTVFYYIVKSYPDAINRFNEIFDNGMELDIYIPSQKIGIEYDGAFWHNTKASFNREREKYTLCKDTGIQLIRIREKLSSDDAMICDFVIESEPYRNDLQKLNAVIDSLSKIIPLYTEYNVIRDEAEIKTFYYTNIKEHSLSEVNPKLTTEWDYNKNNKLLPSMVSIKSSDKVWWRCSNGHSWKAAIYNRSKGSECPYCAGNKAIIGESDLQSTHPELMEEWDYDKNSTFLPNAISKGSSKPVWWICPIGHSWKTSIYNRTVRKTGCPYCSNNLVLEGFNDLQTLHPQLVTEWNYGRNLTTPNKIKAGSTQKVWWICPLGHEWEAQVRSRVRGNGCPICRRKK